MATKQVIVMRTDLNMRKGKMIAQGAHAAMKWLVDMMRYEEGDPIYIMSDEQLDWLSNSFTKVCVRVKSEAELRELIGKARMEGLTVKEILDNGTTEFHGVKTLTCCAIGPHEAERIDKVTGHLELL